MFVAVVKECTHEHLIYFEAVFHHHSQLLALCALLACLCKPLDHAAVGDEVTAVSLGLHADKEFFSPVQVSALVCGINQCVLGEVVWLGFFLLAHGVENQFGLLEFSVKIKHLEYSGVENGV